MVDRKLFSIAAVVLFSVAGYMAFINAAGPVQRDGSLFIFMANNIYAGQPPYWASFDTKNPFVEYYWSLVYVPLAGWLGVVSASRVAEGIYLALTGLVVFYSLLFYYRKFLMPQQEQSQRLQLCSMFRPTLFAMLLSVSVVYLLSNWRVVDNGFNISIYQGLLEALALLLAVMLIYRRSLPLSLLFGGIVFFAWWTKQTSLLSIFPPLLVSLFWAYKSGCFRQYLCASAIALVTFLSLVALFVLVLWQNETLAYYQRGTHGFHLSTLADNMKSASLYLMGLLSSSWAFPKNTALWVSALFVIVVVAVSRDVALCKRRGDQSIDTVFLKVFLASWLFGAILQATIPLNFYPHYYLSAWVPAVLNVGVHLLDAKWVRDDLRGINAAIALLLFFALFHYYEERPLLEQMRSSAPIYQRVEKLSEIIPPESTVFVWGGLAHFHILNNKSSDYAQNMWWPYIRESMSDAERDEEISAHLKGNPPDYFIEFYESYR
ncbi:MAG: hypothetical protein GXP10_07600, partial [Gammaproteobacteria bacterium]|nr:hypothetical protein [Gammaproteobacteria bacterium]